MPQKWKTVRIFISSTFLDMHAERDHLVRFVFPELKEKCRKNHVHLIDVDLRWGVTQADAQDGKALDICLDEIDSCRPYFLGLLGQRYGWVPPGEEHSITAQEIYHGVLHNEIPKQIVDLRRIIDGKLEGKVLTQQQVNCLVRCYSWDADKGKYLLREDASDDEKEIIRAVFAQYSVYQRDRSFFFFRSESLTKKLAGAKVENYFEFDKATQDKLAALKQDIIDEGLPWFEYDDIEVFGEKVGETLWQRIEAELGEPIEEEKHWLEGETEFHELFMADRTKRFVGRRDVLDRIHAFCEQDGEPSVMVITGEPGCGKSALMARFGEEIMHDHPDWVSIPHFIGASPGSTNLRQTLRRLCFHLNRFIESPEEIPEDIKELIQVFPELLTKVAEQKRVFIILDALNQFEKTDNAHAMRWLPQKLPENVRFLVSTLAGEAFDALKSRWLTPKVEQVTGLNEYEIRELVIDYLQEIRHEFPNRQVEDSFFHKVKAGNPLYILVALEELRVFGKFEKLSDRVDRLPDTVPSLFDQVLERIETDFNPELVRDSMSFIACGRQGMTSEELQTLLSAHAPQLEAGAKPEKLPDMLWARLYRAFGAYLFERSGVIDFFHRQLREAVGKRYLEEEADRNAMHKIIADYFEKRWREPYLRALDELPHQLTKATDWDGAERILTDLSFIEAKCVAGMVYELSADYNSILQHLPNSPLSEYLNFISPRAAFLAEYPHECLAEVASELDTTDSTVLQIVEARRTLDKSNRSWLEKVVGKRTIGSWLTEPTTAVAFSPDGSIVLTAHNNGKVLIWQRDNWRLRTIHSSGNSGIIRLHVFDDNLHYLIVPSYGEMQIASIETGLTVERFGDLWDADAAYVAGNTLLVVNRRGGELWSLKTQKPHEILTDNPPDLLPYWAGLNGVGISRDRGLWDLTTAQRKGTINLKFVPDEYEWREHLFGSIIPYCLLTYDVAIHVGESLTVHSQPSGKVKEKYNLNNVVSKPYGYRVGALVTIGHMRKILVVWKHGGQVMQVINLPKHQSELIQFDMYIHAVEFDLEENSIFVCLADSKLVFQARHHSLRIFSSETLQELPAPPCLPSSKSEILLSSDGSLAFSEKKELYETETGHVRAIEEIPDKIWSNPRGAAPFIGFNRDSGYLTLYNEDGSTETLVKLFQAPTKARVSVEREVVVLAEGTHEASSVTIFRGSRIDKHNIDKHGDGLSVDLSPKGKWFLAAINLQSSIGPTYGYSLCLLDTENGRVVRSNREILSFINMAIFIPNSTLVGVAFADGSVQIRTMPNLEVFWSNKFHVGNIRKISASPDGFLLATVGMDQKLIITRISQGEAIAAKPFGFTPLDCEFTSARQLVLAAPGNEFFKYKIHV